MEEIKQLFKTLNEYGLPIPVIAIIIIAYRIVISKINWWSKRENYYNTLLTNLGNWQDALDSALTYFMEPGSEYDDTFHDTPASRKYYESSARAHKEIKEKIHFAQLFLSEQSVKGIEELISREWVLSNIIASSTCEYLKGTRKIVSKCYDQILKDAKNDIKKSHKLEFLTSLLKRNS
ncbi:hypothetical protein [Flavobacterium ginsenosidimutans]|uniref:hypothetical protein n=1 Tax=Flavobacterium ginsenosidimutans TaxID=687844 RepID=UPI003D97B72A